MLGADDLKAYAKELGFTHMGIARAGMLAREGAQLNEWCARGYDASMGWMKKRRRERTNPAAILHDVRSVIVVGLNYAASPGRTHGTGGLKISQYARGRDYHEVLGERLEALLRWIQSKEPAAEGRFYVDTGPVLEKAWAVRAGIGWMGKHTNVITRDYGSLIFLGVLLTTLEIEPDAPATDQCGTCTRCIDACPTQALVEPYVLDARRCISYLTIEHRGEISDDLAAGVGPWIFGCDICQDVCPWNVKFTQPSIDPAWTEGSSIEEVSPGELQSMTADRFNEMFRNSPIRRARWEGFMRNVRNALKNLAGNNH
jgi:epoxyqueuosine reductase